jgi:hypothetical protein
LKRSRCRSRHRPDGVEVVVHSGPTGDAIVLDVRDPIAGARDELQVVGDDEDRAILVREPSQQTGDAAHPVQVVSARGLVEYEDSLPGRHARRDGQALLLAAGRRRWVPAGHVVQGELAQDGVRVHGTGLTARQAEGHLGRRALGEELVTDILKHRGGGAYPMPARGASPVQEKRPPRLALEAAQGAAQRGLARAIRPPSRRT